MPCCRTRLTLRPRIQVSQRVFRPLRTRSRVLSERVGAVRLAITLFALLAFTLQSYITQIHIHGAAWSSAVTLDAGKAQQQGKLPIRDDQGSCPICQLIAHAGQFVAPSAVAIALPTLAAFRVTADKGIATATSTASHNWKSRAPPRN